LLTPWQCLKLDHYFCEEPEYWMRLQHHHLFPKTQHDKAAEFNTIVPLKVSQTITASNR
jgi:plasmid maintenance system antidote protein VapI